MNPRWHRTSKGRICLFVVAVLLLAACGDLEQESAEVQQSVAQSPSATPTPTTTQPEKQATTDESVQTENCGHDGAHDQSGESMNEKVQVDEELLDQAEREGTVSVIVTLDVPYTPEAELGSQAEIDEQRAAIEAAQDELVSSLEGHNVTETTRYEMLPQIVLTVDKPALIELSQSPLVKDIQGNVLDPPAS